MTDLEDLFMHMHKNPPAPFNEYYDEKSSDYLGQAATSMEVDGYYDAHTRKECATEIKRRIEVYRKEDNDADKPNTKD